jgi:hypothetical protein
MDEFLDKILDEMNLPRAEPVEVDSPEPIESTEPETIAIVPEFYTIINDFVKDIQITFPEYIPVIQEWWKSDADEQQKDEQCQFVFRHCLKTIPLKLFDILQQNAALFQEKDTEFLPNIFFKDLWNASITENTRNVIWKYLRAIMNAITKSIKTDGINIFDHFNSEEMVEKLKETIDTVQNMFAESGLAGQTGHTGHIGQPGGEAREGKEVEPTEGTVPKELQDHFQDMTKGKIGKLAFELAEETAKNLNLDENVTNTQDIFTNLIKNPTKLMNIVKNMGSKLDEKMKSGDIDESEIMNEGTEMLNKMKDIPGLGDLNKMFGNFENLFANQTPSQQGAVQTKVNQNLKLQQMKDRMNKKREARAVKKDPELAKIEDIQKMLTETKDT